MISRMLSFLFFVVIIGLLVSCGIFKKRYSGDVSDHFNGKKFVNSNGRQVNGAKELFKFMRTRNPTKWIKEYETYSRDIPIENNYPDRLKLIFINHSTFLIQLDTLNILTDPIWSERRSPCNGPDLKETDRLA